MTLPFLAECIEIWTYVENKLNISIPLYIKNVLSYCGYDNFHTISSFEENDLEYLTTEVRKGGIVKYFHNEYGRKNALQGSTKTEQNFEFSRGHQKLILAIVNLVKKNLNENGVDAFLVKIPKPKKTWKKNKNLHVASEKEVKDVSVSTEVSILKETKAETDSKLDFHENLINLQAKLLKQTLQSLYTHSSDMYAEVCKRKHL